MAFDRVSAVHRQEAKDLIRLARRRGVDIQPAADQLDDPDFMARWFRHYGDPPGDRLLAVAQRLARTLGRNLTALQAMNRWHCRHLIQAHEADVQVRLPSERQIALARRLARHRGVALPEAAEVSLTAWDDFMASHCTRDDFDKVDELVWQLQIPLAGKNPRSYGFAVPVLIENEHLLDDPEALEAARHVRMGDMLRNGMPVDEVIIVFGCEAAVVEQIARELEGQNYEIAY